MLIDHEDTKAMCLIIAYKIKKDQTTTGLAIQVMLPCCIEYMIYIYKQ